MPVPAIDPSFSVSGPEWNVEGVEPIQQPGQDQGQGFGGMLTDAISSLQDTQTEAAKASQALASGTATDPTQVVMDVERARLAMQLASQIRNKTVEAYHDIFRTQV